jgi:Family of unknown function (DUF5947)
MSAVLKLRRFLEAPRQPVPAKGEMCEMCGAPLPAEHGHIVDMENRRLMCTCRPCHLLFTNPGAAQGKFRAVGGRYLPLTAFALNEGQWIALQIPVDVAFFLRNSATGRVLAFYPSPAGATESGLPLEMWDEIVAANPVLSTLEPDVEALLISQRSGHAWIVPVDACYELVGRIRRHWRGFEGGEEAWLEIEAFFAGLPARANEGEL